MIVNPFVTIVIAVVMGYFIGSISTAYIVTRLKTGKDIRKLGGGNVGGLNTYKEVGPVSALFVTLIDIGKGAAAAAISVLAKRDTFGFTRYLVHCHRSNCSR